MNLINIKLNGQEKQVAEGTTIQNLLDEMNITNKMIVVEKNLEIVPKDQYASYNVSEGDNIEIVGFFGGG